MDVRRRSSWHCSTDVVIDPTPAVHHPDPNPRLQCSSNTLDGLQYAARPLVHVDGGPVVPTRVRLRRSPFPSD
jgi:hypothetical protein